ncbi:MAG: deoxycytidylate deaminase [Planctomycetota bacterium]|jgi:dCMP deaminase
MTAPERRPSWDEYFLRLAEDVSRRSPDPSTKHGCVIVDADRRVVSTGYNGPVAGLTNDIVPLTRPEKYDWLIHAEDNAVAFARCDLRGATAYVTGAPCAACFRRLVQVGIRRIVHGERTAASLTASELDACQKMADDLGVEWVLRTVDGAVSMTEAPDYPVS